MRAIVAAVGLAAAACAAASEQRVLAATDELAPSEYDASPSSPDEVSEAPEHDPSSWSSEELADANKYYNRMMERAGRSSATSDASWCGEPWWCRRNIRIYHRRAVNYMTYWSNIRDAWKKAEKEAQEYQDEAAKERRKAASIQNQVTRVRMVRQSLNGLLKGATDLLETEKRRRSKLAREAAQVVARAEAAEAKHRGLNRTAVTLRREIARVEAEADAEERRADRLADETTKQLEEAGRITGEAAAKRVELTLDIDEDRDAIKATEQRVAALVDEVADISRRRNSTRDAVKEANAEYKRLVAARESASSEAQELAMRITTLQAQFATAADERRAAMDHAATEAREQAETEQADRLASERADSLSKEQGFVDKVLGQNMNAASAASAELAVLSTRRQKLLRRIEALSNASALLRGKKEALEHVHDELRVNSTAVKQELARVRSDLARQVIRQKAAEADAERHRARADSEALAGKRAHREALGLAAATTVRQAAHIETMAEGLMGFCDCSEDAEGCDKCGPKVAGAGDDAVAKSVAAAEAIRAEADEALRRAKLAMSPSPSPSASASATPSASASASPSPSASASPSPSASASASPDPSASPSPEPSASSSPAAEAKEAAEAEQAAERAVGEAEQATDEADEEAGEAAAPPASADAQEEDEAEEDKASAGEEDADKADADKADADKADADKTDADKADEAEDKADADKAGADKADEAEDKADADKADADKADEAEDKADTDKADADKADADKPDEAEDKAGETAEEAAKAEEEARFRLESGIMADIGAEAMRFRETRSSLRGGAAAEADAEAGADPLTFVNQLPARWRNQFIPPAGWYPPWGRGNCVWRHKMCKWETWSWAQTGNWRNKYHRERGWMSFRRNNAYRRRRYTKRLSDRARNVRVSAQAVLKAETTANEAIRKQAKEAGERRDAILAQMKRIDEQMQEAYKGLAAAQGNAEGLSFEVEDLKEARNSVHRTLERAQGTAKRAEEIQTSAEESLAASRRKALATETSLRATQNELEQRLRGVTGRMSGLQLKEEAVTAELNAARAAKQIAEEAETAARHEAEAAAKVRDERTAARAKLEEDIKAARAAEAAAKESARASLAAIAASRDSIKATQSEMRALRAKLERTKAAMHAASSAHALGSSDASSVGIAVRRLQDAVSDKEAEADALKARLARVAEEARAYREQMESARAARLALEEQVGTARARVEAAGAIARKEAKAADAAAAERRARSAERDALASRRGLVVRTPLERISETLARRQELEALVGGERAETTARSLDDAALDEPDKADDASDLLPVPSPSPVPVVVEEEEEAEETPTAAGADQEALDRIERDVTVTADDLPADSASGDRELDASMGLGRPPSDEEQAEQDEANGSAAAAAADVEGGEDSPPPAPPADAANADPDTAAALNSATDSALDE